MSLSRDYEDVWEAYHAVQVQVEELGHDLDCPITSPSEMKACIERIVKSLRALKSKLREAA
jgi:hypothetical protein